MTDAIACIVTGPGRLQAPEARAVPTPRAGEALLRVHATSVNYHDILGIDGVLPTVMFPRVPFSDGVATILELGEGVDGFAVGDRVVPNFFPLWERGKLTFEQRARVLGDHLDGMLQSHISLPATSLAHAPPHLEDVEAATLSCAGLTAWRALSIEADLQPGQTVLLQGTGGVSLFALGFAKSMGARVIITSSSDEKLARARGLGADVTINYRRTPDWDLEVLKETDGLGADAVVEVGGGETLSRSIKALRVGGHLSVIGVLAGFAAPSFPLAEVMTGNLTLSGLTVGSTSDLRSMCRAIEASGYRPVVDKVFDLGEADEAIALMRRQGHFGKIAIRTI